ncbi:MAG: hypothetical protein K9L59_09220 [Desulfobacterales bacterium]|nr:hypothetical protein [Desulfobacterales bacterium]MCF8080893.1 hypothetical protein [Desulfobacterales bacterium]
MTLNPKQVKVVIASAAIFIAMGLCPPWTYTLDSESIHREKPAGYALIIAPPAPERKAPAFGVRLDISRLLVQWLVLGAATVGAVLLVKEPRVEKGSPEL